jgi:hypothetical protein
MGMQLNPNKIVAFFMFLGIGGLLLIFVRTGQMRTRRGAIISRYERPVLFWVVIALLCLVACFALNLLAEN